MNETTENQELEQGQWAIIQQMGHKVLAGYIRKDETFGIAMIRLDVPETSQRSAYTKHIHPQSIYDIAYVSEAVARKTAEACDADPIPVYVPDISDTAALKEQVQRLRERLASTGAMLPAPEREPEHEEDEFPF